MISLIRQLVRGLHVVDLTTHLFEVGDAERYGLYLIRQGDDIATHSDKRKARAELAERTSHGDRIRQRFTGLWQAKPWAWLQQQQAEAQRSATVMPLRRRAAK